MYLKSKNTPLLVIIGETASGKSCLALELAKRLNGEIICADSWTVRKELNIGTDKPNENDRMAIPHHLLNLVGPCSDFTAAVFKTLALKSIENISLRGKLPVMVGGSGLYLDSVIFDYKFLKPSTPSQRKELDSMNIEQLLEKITEMGLPLSKQIDLNNKRRLIRVIESGGATPQKSELRDNTVVLGIKLSANELKVAIEQRVNRMIKTGLEQEVRNLSNKYGWECVALKGVGYKQWQRYFEGSQSLEETRLQIISATNNLAKKQRTWFKRNKSIHWLKQPIDIDSLVGFVTTELAI